MDGVSVFNGTLLCGDEYYENYQENSKRLLE